MQENIWHDIASIVCEKSIDPRTERPLTVAVVERAMKDINYNVNPKKNAKQQALDVIHQLIEKGYPIERAKLVLRVTAENPVDFKELLKEHIVKVLSEKKDSWTLV
jgi:ribosome maturation protein SDO1